MPIVAESGSATALDAQYNVFMWRGLRLLLLLLIFSILSACAPPSSAQSWRAAYLVQGEGQLAARDLAKHPEIIVTNSFDQFKQAARHRIDLWIDINAVGLVDRNWLNEKPQRFYPIVLTGFSDALCAFRDTLGGFSIIEGPYADCSSPPPGFSVWMLEEETSSGVSAFMRGYKQVPTVNGILEITNPLLSKH